MRLLVRVLDRPGGKRIAAKVSVTDPGDGSVKLDGTSRDESADLNNLLPFQIARDHAYKLRVEWEGKVLERDLRTNADGEQSEQSVTMAFGE